MTPPTLEAHADADDILNFARLSGDFNPVHLSPEFSRRTIFGGPVAHGVFLLLTGLDRIATQLGSPVHLTQLRATFHRSVPVGSAFTIRIKSMTESAAAVVIENMNQESAATIKLKFDPSPRGMETVPNSGFECSAPTDSTGAYAGCSGKVGLNLDRDRMRALAPHALERFSPDQLSIILATTRIIGMHCPGLHSVYCALDLTFASPGVSDGEIHYKAIRFEEELGSLEVQISNIACKGTLSAFVRPAPVNQPSSVALKSFVSAKQYLGRVALVIGGSRGIGELSAKLLALGGAKVALTFQTGESDAKRVVSDIHSAGGSAFAFHLDAGRIAAQLHLGLGPDFRPTHIYYCATPPVKAGRKLDFDSNVYENFCRCYVSAMSDLVTEVERLGFIPIRIIAPSSDFMDAPKIGFAEYSKAKAAAEALASQINHANCGVMVRMPRLPRLRTDLTNSFAHTQFGDSVPSVLRLLDDRAP